MSLPKPPTPLDGSCSVIHDNTLYSFTPAGFLSLELAEGAEWKKLEMGQSVTGATCVGTTPADPAQAGLFVIGGQTDSADYHGLQKFTFGTGNWTTITPSVQVTQNRRWHGSTYIKADDVLLVYGGSQDGSHGPSSQTFTIQASPPYNALSYQSSASPAVTPLVMSWSDADAAMMAGDGADGKIYWFNPAAGWRDSGASLAQPVNMASGSVNAVLLTGDDNSKSLYTFDLGQSPNHVSRAVVQDATGKPLANAQPLSARNLDKTPVKKRALTMNNWPKYNSTLAPTDTRKDFAMAQSSNGQVVFSGGNSNDPLSIFDAPKNSWLNATDLLVAQDQIQEISSSTTSARPTSTSFLSSTVVSTATQTADSVPTDIAVPPLQTSTGGSDPGPSSNAILGITLGTIAGFLVLLGLILFLLRLHKRRQLHVETGNSSGNDNGNSTSRKHPYYNAEEKEIFGISRTNLPPPSPGYFRGHQHTMSQESTSSMAILMGRVGHRNRSDDAHSSTGSLHKQLKSTISKPIPRESVPPILLAEDDKGVAFSPTVAAPRMRNGPTEGGDGTRRSSGWNRYWSGGSALQILGFGGPKRSTIVSDRSSRYSQASQRNPRATQDSVTVPPLSFGVRPEMSRVNSGSPVVSSTPHHIPWKEGMSGTIERPVSVVSGYSSGIPESVHEAWNAAEASKPWGTDRAPSSAYSSSLINVQQAPPGVSKQPQLAMAATSSDMSWLNLGDHSGA